MRPMAAGWLSAAAVLGVMFQEHTVIDEYIQKLRSVADGIDSLWLFGSRANGTSTSASDWDLMLFANESTLSQLKTVPHLKHALVDVLVVYDGLNFVEPWPESEDYIKSGDLDSWAWVEESASSARYRATKYLDEDEWFKLANTQVLTLKAGRLWP